MKPVFFTAFLFLIAIQLSANPRADSLKPRVIVLTDVSTWETDDSESLVRLLVHADLLEIEGLIFTTGWSLGTTRDDFFDLIHDAVNAYEKDLSNLRKRSGQEGQLADESRQHIGYWPGAAYLRSRTVFGSENRGLKFIGEDNDSPGSDLIINMADEDDERPLWVLAWGGGNTLAQAIWRVREDRDAKQLEAFLSKIRFYTITDQDRDQRTPYDISSHYWLRREFEKELFFIWDECAWKFQNSTGRSNWYQYAGHIQGHGHLGKVYPKYKYGVEGDTPSFLYVLPNGLNQPEHPGWGSWGGYFEWAKGPDEETFAYTNHNKTRANAVCKKYQEHFYPATFNNFAARMDWAKDGAGNRNPVAVVNGDSSLEVITLSPEAGTSVTLDASDSYDPDRDNLAFSWWVLSGAGTYTEDIILAGAGTNTEDIILSGTGTDRITVPIPDNAAGKSFHIICEIKDDGTHPLTGYRRIIIEPKGPVPGE
ncbi:MAG: nucleoside hydrolase-like domain-containing protein [Bacteroidota bacterium]